jgi:hypothetical protein
MKEIYEVLEVNLCVNPLCKEYMFLAEIPDTSIGLTILSSQAIKYIIANQQAKGIITKTMSINPYDKDLQILQDVDYYIPVSRKRSNEIFHSGSMFCRKKACRRKEFISDIIEGFGDDQKLTLQTALFSFLFPHLQGYYSGSMDFFEYIKSRMQQLFNAFMLYKPYLLLMYILHQSIQLGSGIKEFVLRAEYYSLMQKHPTMKKSNISKQLMKKSISKSLLDSSSWHSMHLKNIKYMINKWRMPLFFSNANM